MEDFKNLLSGFNIEKLDNHLSSIYGVWNDYTIGYFNTAWSQFAKDNNGEPDISRKWGLGANIFDAIPEVLKHFYQRVFQIVAKRERSANLNYECSSPELFRKFIQTIYPLRQGGLLIVNSLNIEMPHSSVNTLTEEFQYIDSQGMVHQCANCRRVQNLNKPDQWDFIPEWVQNPSSKVSHSLCTVCQGFYYHIDDLSYSNQ